MQERHVGMRCPLNSKGQRSNAFSHLITKTLHPSHLCWRYWMLINSKSVTWRERVTYERVQFKIWPQKKSGVRSKWKNEKWKTVSSKEKPVNGGKKKTLISMFFRNIIVFRFSYPCDECNMQCGVWLWYRVRRGIYSCTCNAMRTLQTFYMRWSNQPLSKALEYLLSSWLTRGFLWCVTHLLQSNPLSVVLFWVGTI